MTDKRIYQVELSPKADRNLERLDKVMASRIVSRLEQLAENADSFGHYALTGQWKGYFRLRVGDYRVIYSIDYNAQVIRVQEIGHRREIYDD